MKKRSIVLALIFPFIFIIIIPFFINAFINIESDYWKIISEHKDAWISYYGAIIGGTLTLGGVWWTLNKQQEQFEKNLKEQKKISDATLAESRRQFEIEFQKKDDELDLLKEQRKEDLAIQYKPILSLTFAHSLIINYPKPNAAVIFYLNVKNIGRGELLNLKTAYINENNPYYFMISYQENQIITQNDSVNLMISIVKLGNLSNGKSNQIFSIDTNEKIHFIFSILFNDAFLNQYTYTYNIDFEYAAVLDTKDVKSVNIQNSGTFLESNSATQKKNIEPRWHAKISIPVIDYKKR